MKTKYTSTKLFTLKNTMKNRIIIEEIRESMKEQGYKTELYSRGKRNGNKVARFPLDQSEKIALYVKTKVESCHGCCENC